MHPRRSALACAAAFAASTLAAGTCGAAVITVERTSDNTVRVSYELNRPVAELGFSLAASGVRAKYWTIDGDALTLANDRIASPQGAPFSSASVRLQPSGDFFESLGERGPARIASVSMGASSSALDLAFLLPATAPADDATILVRNAYDPRVGACVAEYEPPIAASAESRQWVVLSTSLDACKGVVHAGASTTMVSEDASPELQSFAAQHFAASYSRLKAQLGPPRESNPALVVAHNRQATRSSTRLSTGGNSLVVALFEGDAGNAPTPIALNRLAVSITSNLVPHWVRADDQQPPERSWLVTGAASYLASLETPPDATRPTVVGNIQLCTRRLTGPPPRAAPVLPVDLDPQNCGLLIQLVYDAIERSESAGQRTIHDLWRQALQSDAADRSLQAAFLATNARAEAAVTGLVRGPTADVAAIAEALRRAGLDARLDDMRDEGGGIAALLSPFFVADCPARQFGFGPQGSSDVFFFNTRESCRTLPSELRIISLEGIGIRSSMRDVFDAALRACAERGHVRLTGDVASQEYELECPATLPSVPQDLVIRDVAFLQ